MVYIQPIITGVFTFIALSFVITLPYLIYQYFKHGAVLFKRAFLMYSFVFYCICAYYMVILPLPSKEAVANMTGPYVQLVPFEFIRDFFHETVLNLKAPSTILPALKQGVFLQPIFNIILTIPLGIYLRNMFQFSFKKVVFISFAVSLFFELTQLSGLYGIYPRPYRLFDVDDLFLNTLGGIFGYGLAPLTGYFFPTQEDMEQSSNLKSVNVSAIRRAIAFYIDTVLCYFIAGFFNVEGEMSKLVFGLVLIVYTIVMISLFNKQTVGMMLTRTKFQSSNGSKRPLVVGVFIRVLTVALLYYVIPTVLNAITNAYITDQNSERAMTIGVLMLYFSYVGFVFIHVASQIFKKNPKWIQDRISHTEIASTYEFKKEETNDL